MSVFFATPCYRSDPLRAIEWATAVASDLRLPDAKISCPVSPWLAVSQAQLVYEFLNSKCDHFFFREDDIFVASSVLRRMLDAKEAALVAPYFVRGTTRFECVFDAENHVVWAGVGCALLTRHVLETLWTAHRDELHFMQDGVELVALFRDFFADCDDGTQLIKGDHAFWYRVRQTGFQINALDDVTVNHATEVSHFKKSP